MFKLCEPRPCFPHQRLELIQVMEARNADVDVMQDLCSQVSSIGLHR